MGATNSSASPPESESAASGASQAMGTSAAVPTDALPSPVPLPPPRTKTVPLANRLVSGGVLICVAAACCLFLPPLALVLYVTEPWSSVGQRCREGTGSDARMIYCAGSSDFVVVRGAAIKGRPLKIEHEVYSILFGTTKRKTETCVLAAHDVYTGVLKNVMSRSRLDCLELCWKDPNCAGMVCTLGHDDHSGKTFGEECKFLQGSGTFMRGAAELTRAAEEDGKAISYVLPHEKDAKNKNKYSASRGSYNESSSGWTALVVSCSSNLVCPFAPAAPCSSFSQLTSHTPHRALVSLSSFSVVSAGGSKLLLTPGRAWTHVSTRRLTSPTLRQAESPVRLRTEPEPLMLCLSSALRPLACFPIWQLSWPLSCSAMTPSISRTLPQPLAPPPLSHPHRLLNLPRTN